MIRKAMMKDIDDIEDIYNRVLNMEECGKARIGWQRGVYPTRDTAMQALLRGDLFVNERDGKLIASAIINHRQMDSYGLAHWRVKAAANEVMVLHTLVVDPQFFGRGIGREFVEYYEQYAKENDCKDLRMDTQEKNHAAKNLYHRLGYEEIGIVPCDFNGIKGISLVLLEKKL